VASHALALAASSKPLSQEQMMAAIFLQLLSAFVLPPLALRPTVRPGPVIQANFASDGGEVDWDKEASKLALPTNPFYKELRSVEPPKLIKDFAETAPPEVQFAIKATVSSLMGNLPEAIGESSITTTGRNLASLMFNMQMTGYMFRNAEYRKGLLDSLTAVELEEDAGDKALPTDVSLPPVSGQVKVEIAEGIETEVDAAAYMAELRSEVEGLRAELVAASQKAGGGDAEGGQNEAALIAYIQNLDARDQQELTQTVSPEVLEAMSQLVAKILIDLNIEREMEVESPASKLRELLIVQLVTGYRLRELEVKDELKDKFWGGDGEAIE